MRKHHDVITIQRIRTEQSLVGNVSIGNADLIECITHPPFVLRFDPGVHEGHPWQPDGVTRHLRHGADPHTGKPQLPHRAVGAIRCALDDERADRPLAAAGIESRLGHRYSRTASLPRQHR